MLSQQTTPIESKMTLPINGRSNMTSTQIVGGFDAMSSCLTTINVANQTQQQRQQQHSIENPVQSVALKSSSDNGTVSPAFFAAAAQHLAVENIMPGIYLTKNFIAWTEENLRSHGYTHIIIIDKHIQELYYPSPVFKLSSEDACDFEDRFDVTTVIGNRSQLTFGKEFEAIDLNFGEKSYLTTVLPNCYRAVRFINKALQAGGNILVIDCNGGEQKCLTIIVAFLMYKYNINFSAAFLRLKGFYKKADLDRFYISQLYEYEPILQVQRAQSRGHSCSRELHSAILKRKKNTDDEQQQASSSSSSAAAAATTTATATAFINDDNGHNQFLDTLNPLTQFHMHHVQQQQQQQQQPQNQRHQQRSPQASQSTPSQQRRHPRITSSATSENPTRPHLQRPTYFSDFYAWDDYIME